MALTEEKKAERRSGIGGSDAPVVMGISPYKDPLELFLRKLAARQRKTLST